MSGSRSRRKGAEWERRVVNDLLERGIPATRSAPMQTHKSNAAPDVDIPGWFIECKVGQQQSPRAALRQAQDDCQNDERIPVAVIKDNGAGGRPAFHFVCVEYQDWLDIVGRLAKVNE